MSGMMPLGSFGIPMGSTRIGAIAGIVPASAVAPSLGSYPTIMSLTGHSAELSGRGWLATAAGFVGLGVIAAFIRCAPLEPFCEADTADAATVVLYSSWLINPFERRRCASRSLASPVD